MNSYIFISSSFWFSISEAIGHLLLYICRTKPDRHGSSSRSRVELSSGNGRRNVRSVGGDGAAIHSAANCRAAAISSSLLGATTTGGSGSGSGGGGSPKAKEVSEDQKCLLPELPLLRQTRRPDEHRRELLWRPCSLGESEERDGLGGHVRAAGVEVRSEHGGEEAKPQQQGAHHRREEAEGEAQPEIHRPVRHCSWPQEDGQDLRSQRRHQVPEAAPGEGEVPGGASREEDRRVGVGPGQEVPPVRRRRRQPLLLLLRRLRLRLRFRRPALRRRVRAAGDRGQDLRQHHPRQDPLREAQGRAGEGALGDREHPPLRHQHQRHALHHFFARHNRHGSDRGGVRHDREGGCQETELSIQTAALKNLALVAENGKKGRLVTTNKKVKSFDSHAIFLLRFELVLL
ncbi:uncharacterized protein LOC122002794 isoform X2 [Zingiber officinale]|uniref:uncharacterized protein LOC122002794 isoform X2 n=1 Tax=Zingiber officinale TaxID=94328 RepID=UPI001C4DC412|nr:uncharacterized protein LOC122002794 isoform X2 [Zingiber officinale]